MHQGPPVRPADHEPRLVKAWFFFVHQSSTASPRRGLAAENLWLPPDRRQLLDYDRGVIRIIPAGAPAGCRGELHLVILF